MQGLWTSAITLDWLFDKFPEFSWSFWDFAHSWTFPGPGNVILKSKPFSWKSQIVGALSINFFLIMHDLFSKMQYFGSQASDKFLKHRTLPQTSPTKFVTGMITSTMLICDLNHGMVTWLHYWPSVQKIVNYDSFSTKRVRNKHCWHFPCFAPKHWRNRRLTNEMYPQIVDQPVKLDL